MPIQFRCQHCSQLMSITRRKAGEVTQCVRCGRETLIPFETDLAPPTTPPIVQDEGSEPAHESIRAESARDPQAPPADDSASIDDPENTTHPHSYKIASLLADGSDEEAEEELAFEIKSRRGDEEEMDLTPMVDVTFLLLIFFMVTASFSVQKSLSVPPPDPDQQGAAQTVIPLDELEENAILIEIDEESRILVEDQPVLDPRDLPTLLAEIRGRENKQEVIVSTDEMARHEAVVTAMDAAQEVGMQRIRWAVQPAE